MVVLVDAEHGELQQQLQVGDTAGVGEVCILIY